MYLSSDFGCFGSKHAIYVVFRPGRSAAADLWDQVDLAVGLERGQIGVLVDLAVDRHRHALLDLMAEAGIAAIELKDEAAEIVRLDVELGLARR